MGEIPFASIENHIRRHSPGLQRNSLETLSEMYGSNALMGTESETPISLAGKPASISIEQGAALNSVIRAEGIKSSLEIGFAYGFSTIWILDALRLPASRHIAVDPFEKTYWNGVGLFQVDKLGPKAKFEWKNDLSIHVLSDMIRTKETVDFIFIDGNHRFDDVLVDFYLADQVIHPGGIIAFDDLWMPSIQTVTNFVLSNRAYRIVAQPVNIMMLQKEANDTRHWDHFVTFSTGRTFQRKIIEKLARLFG